MLLAVGLYGGLVVAPADYFQSDAYRIIYVHVPVGLSLADDLHVDGAAPPRWA